MVAPVGVVVVSDSVALEAAATLVHEGNEPSAAFLANVEGAVPLDPLGLSLAIPSLLAIAGAACWQLLVLIALFRWCNI